MKSRPHLWALVLTAVPFLFGGCRRMHKQPFEKAPLVPGQIETARLSERPSLVVERLRFWSAADAPVGLPASVPLPNGRGSDRSHDR